MLNGTPLNSTALNATAKTSVSFSVQVLYTNIIGYQFAASYTEIVSVSIGSSYGARPIVSKGVSSPYSSYTNVGTGIVVPYGNTLKVSASAQSIYTISNTSPLVYKVTSLYMQLGASHVNVAASVTAVINGLNLESVSTATASLDEGAGMWRGQITLTSLSEYLNINPNDALTLTIYGEVFQFVVDSKSRGVNGVGIPSYSLALLSLSANYAAPRATLITNTWATTMLASDIAKELIPTCIWNAQDWLVPSAKFSASYATPLNLVTTLASIIGAKVNCTKLGVITVDAKYPIRPKAYALRTPNHTLFDVTDLLSLNEQGKYSKLYNSIRVSNSHGGYSDSLSFVADTNSKSSGELRLRLSPWRSTITLRNSQSANINWNTSNGVLGSQELIEVVPIINGVGVTSKPIASISSWVWLSDPLGSVSALLDSKEVRSSLNGTSLVRVTYTSRYLGYRVTGTVGDANLYYVENN